MSQFNDLNKEQLREKCDEYGIEYAPQAGEKKLKELLDDYYESINAFDGEASEQEKAAKEQAEKEAAEEQAEVDAEVEAREERENLGATVAQPKLTAKRKRFNRIKEEATKLIRVTVTCHNPMFKNWKGQPVRIENKAIGVVHKFVPFTQEPFHLPKVIVDHLKDAKYQAFRMVKRNGREVKEGYETAAYSVVELPLLTEKELEALRKDQAARGHQPD